MEVYRSNNNSIIHQNNAPFRDKAQNTGHPFGGFPEELKSRRCWMGTRFVKREDGKTSKPPVRVRIGRPVAKADKTNEKNWASFEEAHHALENGVVDAIGFVFTKDDPYTVIDLDNVIDPESGEIEAGAADILTTLDTYTEVSASGKGLHLICEADKPGERCRSGKMEMYDGRCGARFVVITGDQISRRSEIPCRAAAVRDLYAKLFGSGDDATTPPPPARRVAFNQTDILEKARNARSGAKFVNLYDKGDVSGYESHSDADYALINSLIFWCAGDGDVVETLFEQSALYRPPPKKDKGYVSRSVRKALASYKGSYYKPKAVREEPAPEQRDTLAPYLALLLDASLWKGQKAAAAYKAYAALVISSVEDGIKTDTEELRVGADVRSLAERAGVNRVTLCRSSLPYLVERKLVTWRRGAGKRAGQFILKTPPAPSEATIKVITQYFNGSTYGNGLDALARLIRMRAGASRTGRVENLGQIHTVARLGMVAMFCMVTLTAAPRGLTTEELAERTGRRKDHVLDTMRKLVSKNIVTELRKGFFSFAEGFWSAYEEELRRSLIVEAERRQRKQHQRERWQNEQSLKEGRAQWHAKRDEKIISLDAERRRKLDKEARLSQPRDDRYLTERDKAEREEHALMRDYDAMCGRVQARMAHRTLDKRKRGAL